MSITTYSSSLIHKLLAIQIYYRSRFNTEADTTGPSYRVRSIIVHRMRFTINIWLQGNGQTSLL